MCIAEARAQASKPGRQHALTSAVLGPLAHGLRVCLASALAAIGGGL
jgi:hypothetical protein